MSWLEFAYDFLFGDDDESLAARMGTFVGETVREYLLDEGADDDDDGDEDADRRIRKLLGEKETPEDSFQALMKDVKESGQFSEYSEWSENGDADKGE